MKFWWGKKSKRKTKSTRQGWSSKYGRKKTVRLSRLGLGWLGAIMVIIGIAIVFRGWLKIGPRHIPTEGFYSAVIMVGRQPIWLGLGVDSGRMSLVMIPRNMWVELPAGLGSYQAQAMWGVDELKQGKGEVLKTAVANLLGLPVEGFMVVDIETNDWREVDWQGLRFFSLIDLLRWQAMGKIKAGSQMSVWDAYLIGKWWREFGGTQKQVLWLNQVGSNLVSEGKLADGQVILRLNESAFDNEISTYFWPAKVSQEQAVVGVKNAGGREGVAGQYARLLANMGLNVVEVGNATNQVKGVVCRVNEAGNYPESVKWLKNLTGCRIRDASGEDRVDIMVLVGQSVDNGRRLDGRWEM